MGGEYLFFTVVLADDIEHVGGEDALQGVGTERTRGHGSEGEEGAQPQPGSFHNLSHCSRSAAYSLPRAFAGRAGRKRVAIVDDVMSAGSALRGTHDALVAQGAEVIVAAAFLILGSEGAAFFTKFGFRADAWQQLAPALIDHARRHEVAKEEPSPFGVRYVVEGSYFRADKPQVWSDARIALRPRAPSTDLDLHPDGKRFAIASTEDISLAKQDAAVFIFNFFDELRRIAPPKK